ncbi:MAG: phosphatase PAP2 family protein [Gemmatimonadales bacterium]
MANFIVRLAKSFRQDSRLLVTFLIGATALFGMAKLASEVFEGDTFAIDKAIMLALRTAGDASELVGPSWIKPAMIDMTALGGAPVLTLVTVLATGSLVAMRRYSTAGFVVLSVSCGSVLSFMIKAIFVRPRPEIVPHLVVATSTSFPSGHAMNSAIVYLTLAVLLARCEANRQIQFYLIGAAILLTLLVGTTRVFLGVHWPTDVLAGWVIGAAWAALCSLAAKWLQDHQAIEQPSSLHSRKS